MAKKVTNKPKTEKNNKKELREKELIEDKEEDLIDFVEYDDEDGEYEEYTPKKKQEGKDERVNKSHKEINFDCMKYLPIATFVVSLISLIVSLVVLSKVNDLDGSTTKKKTTNEEETTETAEYDTSMFKEIDADEFVDLINNKKEYYFVYTGRPSCGYCQMMIGNYQKSVKEYDYDLYYYDTEYVTSEIVEKIQGLDEIFEEDFPATPMVYLVGKGGVKDVNEGYTEYDIYAQFLEDNGVDKK